MKDIIVTTNGLDCRYDLKGLVNSDNMDSMIKVNVGDELELQSNRFDINNKFKGVFYKAKSGMLTLKVIKSPIKLKVSSYLLEESKIKFNIDLNKYIDKESKYNAYIEIFNNFEKGYGDEVTEENLFYKEEVNLEYIQLDMKNLFSGKASNYNQYFELMINMYDGDNNRYKLDFSDELKSFYNGSKYELENSIVNIDLENSLEVTLTPIQRKPIKICVLGSCFSRAAFNTKEAYYNTNYKLYTSVPLSQFWFSVISTVSKELPEKFNESILKNEPDVILKDVKREYYKTTFKEIEECNIDYVLMDFFVDAIHGVRLFDDGKVIVRNYELGKSDYYRNVIIKETKKFNYASEGFWDTWTSSCDIFIERLLKIIPEEKIILNVSANMSERYYDLNGEERNFVKDKKFNKEDIKYYNMIWRKMNRYFVSKLPNCRIIDMKKFDYISDERHPISTGPHHFESDFYKKIFDEILRVIVFNNKV